MFRKLIELIAEALKNFIGKETTITGDLSTAEIYTISEVMQDAIDKWREMYKDEASWLDERTGIYSLGLSKLICQSLASQVLSEMKLEINTPGEKEDSEDDPKDTRASFLQDMLDQHFMKHLLTFTEKAMALGGVVFKPYLVNNHIYIDTTYQGQFVPIAFDDDGYITDIAFLDQFVSKGKLYTKVERQMFDSSTSSVTVTNRCFVAPQKAVESGQSQDLGKEIDIAEIERWKGIAPEAYIENVERPLFGYYKTPLANNLDLDCPLGISIFNPAVKLIERADKQFSRLDWEYEGGQIAIDIDSTAIKGNSGYYGTNFEQDSCKDRLYRSVDLGNDDTYHAFAPSLRDGNYTEGLNTYLSRIEDACGLARGTISNVEGEARTATEMKILKQRTFTTISSNQQALEDAIEDLVYAMDVYASLYNLAPLGDYCVDIEWSDSILTDTDTELAQKIQLQQIGVIGKAELRAWYLGEDLDTAKSRIEQIKEEESSNLDEDFDSQMEGDGQATTSSEDDQSMADSMIGMLNGLLEEI